MKVIRFVLLTLFWFATGFMLVWIGMTVISELAHSRPGPQWANEPVAIRDWFQNLMQPDNPAQSCCGEADAYEADDFETSGDHYVAIVTDGHGVIPNGTRINVPNSKMKWDKGNPTGHGILFIGASGTLYCYVAPGGA